MRKLYVLLLAFLLPLLLPSDARAQSTADQVVPGYVTTTGCPGGLPSCWKPYDTTGAGIPTTPGPSSVTPTSLDISTVAGSAVNALSAGHATKGGFVVTSNAAGICVNQKGAAGTASNGDTACVAQNQPYYLAPSAGAVSVNSTGNPVTLAGYGYN